MTWLNISLTTGLPQTGTGTTIRHSSRVLLPQFDSNDLCPSRFSFYGLFTLPGDCNPDHYPKERDLMRRPPWCTLASSGVFHEISTTKRKGEGKGSAWTRWWAGRWESWETKREKGQDFSQPSPERSLDAGLLRSCPWYAYKDETRSYDFGLPLKSGRLHSLRSTRMPKLVWSQALVEVIFCWGAGLIGRG